MNSEVFSTIFGLFYGLPSIIGFVCGVMSADFPPGYGCGKPVSKIEYVYPAFRLGCYLNKSPGAK